MHTCTHITHIQTHMSVSLAPWGTHVSHWINILAMHLAIQFPQGIHQSGVPLVIKGIISTSHDQRMTARTHHAPGVLVKGCNLGGLHQCLHNKGRRRVVRHALGRERVRMNKGKRTLQKGYLYQSISRRPTILFLDTLTEWPVHTDHGSTKPEGQKLLQQ